MSHTPRLPFPDNACGYGIWISLRLFHGLLWSAFGIGILIDGIGQTSIKRADPFFGGIMVGVLLLAFLHWLVSWMGIHFSWREKLQVFLLLLLSIMPFPLLIHRF